MMTHKLDLISKLLFTSLLIGHLIVYSSGQQYDSPSSINSVDNNRFFMNPNNIYPSNNAFFATSVFPPSSPEIRACYDSLGRAQRCVPAFENAAYMRRVEASNTCGEKVEGRTEFCVQTPKANPSQSRPQYTCNWCQRGQHEARNVNDFNDNSTDVTWWQSDTMFDGIEYPKTVNITLHLGERLVNLIWFKAIRQDDDNFFPFAKLSYFYLSWKRVFFFSPFFICSPNDAIRMIFFSSKNKLSSSSSSTLLFIFFFSPPHLLVFRLPPALRPPFTHMLSHFRTNLTFKAVILSPSFSNQSTFAMSSQIFH